MTGKAAYLVVGTVLVIGGFVFAVLSGVPDLCTMASGFCLSSPEWLQPILSGLGVAVTTIGFGIIFMVANRRTKTSTLNDCHYSWLPDRLPTDNFNCS